MYLRLSIKKEHGRNSKMNIICVKIYYILLEMTKEMHTGVTKAYEEYVFFPEKMKRGIFTIMAKDNIDLNASSNFVKSHLHVTSLSVLQPISDENEGFPVTSAPLESFTIKIFKTSTIA